MLRGRKIPKHFYAGDAVRVRLPAEILATLGKNGTLDGVPFMPEMCDSCGKLFRVSRRAEKICVENLDYKMRRFPASDVVFLEGMRCNGSGHDDCCRACRILWKEAWLQPASQIVRQPREDAQQARLLRKRLRVKRDPLRYFCQSTQLLDATEAFPWRLKPWLLWVAIREVWIGERSPAEQTKLLAAWFRRMTRRWIFGKRRLRGPCSRTPSESLGLAKGEWVEIKPLSQILGTLDHNGDNRGLNISYAMGQNCGQRVQVGNRVDRIISESTGEMRNVNNTVTLEGLMCHCYYQLGGCPRGELQFWREIWLRRCPPVREAVRAPRPQSAAGNVGSRQATSHCLTE